jgi:HK97 gp10 family phage protein
MGADITVEGFKELADKLRAITPALRKRVIRNALAAGAREVRDEAKRRAPVLSASIKAPYRKPGTVRDAIRVRSSKVARRAGDIGVFVNVVPAKGAKFKTTTTRVLGLKVRQRKQVRASGRGAQSPTDPFYWRFLEFGTRKMAARSFLQPGAAKLGQALQIFQSKVGQWFEKTNATGKVIP